MSVWCERVNIHTVSVSNQGKAVSRPAPPSLPSLSSRPRRPQVGVLECIQNEARRKGKGEDTGAARNGRRGREREGRNLLQPAFCLEISSLSPTWYAQLTWRLGKAGVCW